MAKFLYWYGAANVMAVAVSLILGYTTGGGAHFITGFLSALSALLWLAVVMFHFIYTGGAIKRVAERGWIDKAGYIKTRGYKKSLFPWALVAIILFTALPFLGAVFDAGKAPLWYHHVVAWEGAAVLGYVFYRCGPMLFENGEILAEAAAAVRAEIEKKRAEKA